jgi:head-tail adaptor
MRWRPEVGRLNALVTVEVPQDVIDAGGATRRSFNVYGQVWAQIRPTRLFMRGEAGRQNGVITHMLTFRSIAGFSCDWRMRQGDRVFVVESFDDGDEISGFTRALCQEVRP